LGEIFQMQSWVWVFQFWNLLILAHFSKFKMSTIPYTHSPMQEIE
jgi:hypothetical protein